MIRASPHAHFNRSRLARLLDRLAVVPDAEPGRPVAEALGDWLGFTDAIALYSALGTSPASPAAQYSTHELPPIVTEFTQAHAALEQAIRAGSAPGSGRLRIKLPRPAVDAPLEIAADYTPYLRYYFAHQRAMEAEATRLRTALRIALLNARPELHALAKLDAALADALAERERSLLASLPLLLEKRFDALRAAHRQALDEQPDAAPDDPGRWMEPGGWLATFCADLQDMLLAELELRLLPATGLLEALQHDHTELQGSTLSP